MTGSEQGFLLLTGFLGDPDRKPLTIPQFRELTRRARQMPCPTEERQMTREDLLGIGCDKAFADRVLCLLSQTEQLSWYLEKGRKCGCFPITRISEGYPDRLRRCLGMDAPGVLWCKGESGLLKTPMVALVGSRELRNENRQFAYQVGRQAALQGYTLVSGNARGADRTAQESCLEHGGKVISVLADAPEKYPIRDNLLYLSEEGYDLAFSAQRALQRNRIIHSLGAKTFVAQCALKKGGTWDGTCRNLQKNWSPVFCLNDGSPAAGELEAMGASLIGMEELKDLSSLQPRAINFIDQ